MEGRKSEVKGEAHRPCAFIGIGNSEQEMQQLSLEDKVRGARERAEGGREGGGWRRCAGERKRERG